MGVRVLHPRVEVTRGVVGRAAKEAGERQDGVVARVRHGLVAGDAFLCHQVGQGTAHARGAVFVVYVYHDAVVGALADGFVQPDGPELVAYLHETELDAFHAPFFIKRQQPVYLLDEGTLVDVKPYADAFRGGVVADGLDVQVFAFGYTGRVALHLHFRSVPPGIQMDVLQSAFGGEVHGGQCFFLRESATECLSRPDPRQVPLQDIRFVQVQVDEVVAIRSTGRSAAMMTRHGVS